MQQRSEETHARILQAAARLFARDGYDATGVARLCAEAGVSKGAFYHHFPSKQAVFLALLDGWLATLDAQMAELTGASKSVPEALLSMAGMAGPFFESAGGQLPMFLEFWRESSHDPRVWQATIAPYHRYQALFAGLLRKGMDEGTLKPVDAERAAQALVSLAVGLMLQAALDPQGAPWNEVTQDALRWFMEGLLWPKN